MTTLCRSSRVSAAITSIDGPQPLRATACASSPEPGSASTSEAENRTSGGSSTVEALPCGSRSTTSVRTPRSQAAPASPRTIEVLPTPPLRLTTLTTSTSRVCLRWVGSADQSSARTAEYRSRAATRSARVVDDPRRVAGW